MSNRYETTIMITPVLSDIQAKALIKEYKDFIEKEGAEILHEEDWGLKKLAYPIKRKSNAYYQLFQYNAKGELIEKLNLKMRRDEQIIRFLVIKMDEAAIDYSETRKMKKGQI